MIRLLNLAVRAYLRHCPVTEGKRRLLRVTRTAIRPRDARQVAPTRHGFSLMLNLDNPEQERIYFYGEHDERYEISLLKRVIRPGMTCWDVGADIGFYSCLLAGLVGHDGRVIAFEPASATRQALRDNLALNRLTNVDVLACALGAEDATAEIYCADPSLMEGTASLYRSALRTRSESIAVARLDTIAGGLPVPDFVKIDVEGAQQEVWRGGERFFSQNSPLVMAELRESTDIARLQALQDIVRAAGYRVFEILKGARVRETGDFARSAKRNFVLAKPDTAAMRSLTPLQR